MLWARTVVLLRLWNLTPVRVIKNGEFEVWLQRPVPEVDLDDVPLVSILSGKQRLGVALHAAGLAESAGMLGSAMTLEHARLMADQLGKQLRAARDYITAIE